MFPAIWKNYILPILSRPAQFQVAGLCYRAAPEGLQVLLITSRETRRWILPKGWPMAGLKASGAAVMEAWEEAGVKPTSKPPKKVGRYRYPKITSGGVPVDTDVDVYAIEVGSLSQDFPEAGERTRQWVSAQEAAERVNEPDLSALLLEFPEQIRGTNPAPMPKNKSEAQS
ncbi:NUDIX hydrolase [Primorskyibacter sp. 2E233]|uniref:NUDIX hydrolase n=1 Tax=Primorskyibacter sp. 2E233 TaxID=3413431 RepID=UPI003BF0E1DA